jgi:hypothetical protein
VILCLYFYIKLNYHDAVATGAADHPQVAPIDAAALDLTPRDSTATETQQGDFDKHRWLL